MRAGERMKKINKNTNKALIIAIVIGLVSCIFLLINGVFRGHDLEYHLSRIIGISNGLSNGDIRALIHYPGFGGFGYANGIFYSNLFLYIPAFFKMLGWDIISVYKLFVILCTIATTVSMFCATKAITKDNKIAFIASVLYTLCSYRLTDVILRAAVGEMLAFIFVPLIVWGFYEIVFGDSKKWYIFSFGFVGLANCHLLSTILMAMIIVEMLILCIKRFIDDKQRFFKLILSGIFGLSLGAFFIIPMLQQYTSADLIINTNENIISGGYPFLKLFVGLPNYTTRFLPSGIGLILVFLFLLRFKIKRESTREPLLKFADLMLFGGVITLLASTDILPWKELSPILGSVQFPWRLFLFSSFFLSIGGAITWKYYLKQNSNYSNLKTLLLIGCTIGSCLCFQLLCDKSLRTYWQGETEILTTYDGFSVAAGEYLPVTTDWSLIDLDERKVRTNSSTILISSYEENGKYYINYKNNIESGTYIDVPLIYYRGYKAVSKETNEFYPIDYGYNTWCRIFLKDKENDEIILSYQGTRLTNVSYMISILTLIGFVVWKSKEKIETNLKRKK